LPTPPLSVGRRASATLMWPSTATRGPMPGVRLDD